MLISAADEAVRPGGEPVCARSSSQIHWQNDPDVARAVRGVHGGFSRRLGSAACRPRMVEVAAAQVSAPER